MIGAAFKAAFFELKGQGRSTTKMIKLFKFQSCNRRYLRFTKEKSKYNKIIAAIGILKNHADNGLL